VATPVVVDGSGRVPASEAERALGRAAGRRAFRRRARALASEVEVQTGAPLVRGNRTRLLIDGPATYAAMLAAVEAARDHVHIETYIFADDGIGRRFAEVLERKRREGVAVRIVYDAIGSLASDREFFADLGARRPLELAGHIDPAAWKARPVRDRISEFLSSLFAYWL
jgi:cardiolipin synthase